MSMVTLGIIVVTAVVLTAAPLCLVSRHPYPELSHFQFKASYEEEKHYFQCRAKESEAREDERV